MEVPIAGVCWVAKLDTGKVIRKEKEVKSVPTNLEKQSFSRLRFPLNWVQKGKVRRVIPSSPFLLRGFGGINNAETLHISS